MINQSTSKQLLIKLPLLAGKLTPDEILLLARKWGSADGQYHSTGWLKKYVPTEMTATQIKELEGNAVAGITDAFNRIFACPNCATDLRKCGLQKKAPGYTQVSKAFIGPNGDVIRDQDGAFTRERNGVYQDEFRCLACSTWLPKGSAPTYFIGKHLSQKIVYDYLVGFVKLENPPQVSVPNNLSDVEVYLPEEIEYDEQDEG